MHELAITESLISLINSEAEERGFGKVLGIRLRVGEYSGIVPECLREFFPIASAGSIAEGAELEIEPLRASFRCLSCGYEGEIPRREARCPSCGGEQIKMTAGREFFVESLTVE